MPIKTPYQADQALRNNAELFIKRCSDKPNIVIKQDGPKDYTVSFYTDRQVQGEAESSSVVGTLRISNRDISPAVIARRAGEDIFSKRATVHDHTDGDATYIEMNQFYSKINSEKWRRKIGYTTIGLALAANIIIHGCNPFVNLITGRNEAYSQETKEGIDPEKSIAPNNPVLTPSSLDDIAEK